MSNTSAQQRNWLFYISFIPIGFVIGGLLGLSVSPVVSIAVTSLTGAAAAIVAGINSLNKNSMRIDPWPLTWLAIGIGLGVFGGLYARNESLLGSNLSIELDKWEAEKFDRQEVARRLLELQYPYAPISQNSPWMTSFDITATVALSSELQMWTAVGLDQTEVARRLFDTKYPSDTVSIATLGTKGVISPSRMLSPLGTLLFTTTEEECNNLRARKGEELRKELTSSTNKPLQNLPKLITDTVTLEKVVNEVLCVAGG
jgi:hypothetical protein